MRNKGGNRRRVYRTLALAVLLLLFLSACSYGERSYEKGREAFLEGDYETSVRELRRAVSQGYTEPEVYADLAYALLKTGDTEKALRNMNTAVKKSPENPALKKRIGLFYREAGDEETAISYLQASLPTNGKYGKEDIESLGFLGELMFRQGRYEEAIELYLSLITLEDHVTEHDILIGEAYLKLNQAYAASQYFSLVLSKEEALPEHFLRIYGDLVAYGKKREAGKYYEEGLRRALLENASMSPGEYCLAAGMPEEAEKYFTDSDAPEARLARAMVLRNEGRFEEAEVIYRALIAEGEGSAEVYNQYLMMKTEEEDYTAAFQLLRQVYAMADENEKKNALYNEMIIYERMGDYETAFEKAQEFRKSYPMDTSADREYVFLKRAAD